MKKLNLEAEAEKYYTSIVGGSPNELDQHSCTIEVIVGFAKKQVILGQIEVLEKIEKQYPDNLAIRAIMMDEIQELKRQTKTL